MNPLPPSPSTSQPPQSRLLFGLNHFQLAFVLARLGLGTNLFFHGLVRLPELPAFVQSIEAGFADTMLPGFLVTPMAYFIPVAEFIIGGLLLLGLRTKEALVASAALMLLLITGCCFQENWGPINSQMFLLVLSAALIACLPHNRLALSKAS